VGPATVLQGTRIREWRASAFRALPACSPTMKTPSPLALAALLLSSCAMLGYSTHEVVYVAQASGGA
jgi:hypothetical protein